MNVYDVSDKIRVTMSFYLVDEDGNQVLMSPTNITLSIKKPDKTVTTYQKTDLTEQETGIFYLEFVVDQVGTWHYRADSSGVVNAGGESSFRARLSNIV
jgi:hypothetical protein